MAKRASKKSSPKPAKLRAPRIASEDLPRRPLADAIPVAEVLRRSYAGKSASWEEIATGLKVNAKDPQQKYPLWSAVGYGLVKQDDQQYSLAEVGRKIIAPEYAGEDQEGKLKAILTPRILSKFYSDYNGSPLPEGDIFLNVLENRFGIPQARAKEARDLIVANGEYVGILVPGIDGTKILQFSLSGPPPTPTPAVDAEQSEASENGAAAVSVAASDETCFVITPIGADGSDERKHANAVLKHLIDPVMENSGLRVVRADKISKPGIITKQVVEHLAYSRLCIADLSFNNPNAFYEMGLRHAFKLPMIQIIRKGDRIPFDVAQGRTILIDCSDPYLIMDAFRSARTELKEHIESVLSGNAAPEDEPMNVYLPGLRVQIPAFPAKAKNAS
ncbi:hypothetical protein GC197_03155 [bacterium]|nr:hypothetical protein [bacterium]